MCRKEKILTLVSILILILTAIFVVARCCRKDEVAVQQTGNVDIGSDVITMGGPGVTDLPDTTVVHRGALTTVYRVADDEAGVVCWIYRGYEKGGIDCLPIEQTRLDFGDRTGAWGIQ